jgi:lathosterol oxidase
MPFLHSLLAITLENALRYFVAAGLAWWLAFRWLRARWAHRKIVPAAPTRNDVRRELAWSLSSLLVFGLVGAAT